MVDLAEFRSLKRILPFIANKLHRGGVRRVGGDRKSTRLNSSHSQISYAVFCLKKKKTPQATISTLSLPSSTGRSRNLHHLLLLSRMSPVRLRKPASLGRRIRRTRNGLRPSLDA